jgi:hypothetical protein
MTMTPFPWCRVRGTRKELSVGVQLKEGQTMLKSAIRRWRDWRRERHIERQERKINARTALRHYKKATGHEGGAPGGG